MVPKYLGKLNKKKLPLFDKFLTTPEFLHQKFIIIQSNAFLFNVWRQPQNGFRKTDTKTRVAESILKN